MGRASGNTQPAASAAAKRRRKAARGAGPAGGLDAQARRFINGTAEHAVLKADPTRVPKGPEHVLGRSGTGAHGAQGAAKHRRARADTKRDLRTGSWTGEH